MNGPDVERLALAASRARLPLLQAYNTKAMKLSSAGLTTEEWVAQYDAILAEGFVPIIQAILADLTAQGLVVVRREDLAWVIQTLPAKERNRPVWQRLRAALTAAQGKE